MTAQEKLFQCFDFVRQKTDFVPDVALVLGSGLGSFADTLEIQSTIDYKDIPGFPVSTVQNHVGRFVFGRFNGVKVVAMQGRVHYYEGYKMTDVVLPVRLMGLLGAKILFLTNAAGGMNKTFVPGTLMAITDHINIMCPNPLIGENFDKLGTRFPDMSNVYNKELLEKMKVASQKVGTTLREGVYFMYSGPSYETPAEIKLIMSFGADAVGMSTACEAIAGNHAGMKVCGISCITNLAAGIQKTPLSHLEVEETARRVHDEFVALLKQCLIEFTC